MIRHHQEKDLLLFTQHHHALLSGQLAERLSGRVVMKPSPVVLQGIALHDSGWPLHDNRPTLNDDGRPLHVFETPAKIGTAVWSESVRIAAETHPRAGLLVSLHALGLSVTAMASAHIPHDRFEHNKFQHRQIEIQELLRRELGLRIDLPLTHGLAQPGASAQEDGLLFEFRLLRAMDQLSLALLCSRELFPALVLYARPAGEPLTINAVRPAEFHVQLDRWPFEAETLEIAVPGRRVPDRRYASDEEFRDVYLGAIPEQVTVRLAPDQSATGVSIAPGVR